MAAGNVRPGMTSHFVSIAHHIFTSERQGVREHGHGRHTDYEARQTRAVPTVRSRRGITASFPQERRTLRQFRCVVDPASAAQGFDAGESGTDCLYGPGGGTPTDKASRPASARLGVTAATAAARCEGTTGACHAYWNIPRPLLDHGRVPRQLGQRVFPPTATKTARAGIRRKCVKGTGSRPQVPRSAAPWAMTTANVGSPR
ncbi:hypothetical protein PCL_03759 [Purpureocillium lilacinum]|uniref:Uncharacterized protein n=1 Tax=Purpureocillium lilacinum TaxID=33203 RepID=A0A2U3EPZ7_PURLI|nr:hypothetical protein PCL_03759 [Purpureocillium lilacinum]